MSLRVCGGWSKDGAFRIRIPDETERSRGDEGMTHGSLDEEHVHHDL